MSEYDEMRMIVCDRKSAITKDDEGLNNEWINEFNETIQMKPGDRLAVYNAFISEKGAGTAESIEFKDINLTGSKILKVTKTQTIPAGDTRNNQLLVAESGRRFYAQIRRDGAGDHIVADRFKEEFMYMDYVENAPESIIQKDNSTSLVINYYKTMDGLCLYQLPRRWGNENFFDLAGVKNTAPVSWSVDDTLATGRCRGENVLIGRQLGADPSGFPPANMEYFDVDEVYGYVLEDYKIILDFQINIVPAPGIPTTIPGQIRKGRTKRLILKNDNSRMTIMMRTKSLFHPHNADGGFGVSEPAPINANLYYDWIPPYYAMDPEYHDYITFRDRVDLSLEPGFTSAKYVSEELTRQLRSSKLGNDDIQTIERGQTRGVDKFAAKTITNLEKFVETSTYRRFVSSNDYLGQEKYYDETLNNSTPPTAPETEVGTSGPTTLNTDGSFRPPQSFDPQMMFYNQYQFIATKRPDLVEAGEELNDIFGKGIVEVPGGFQNQLYYTTNPVITDIPYTPENLLKLKNFIDAQGNYPELFSAKNIRNVCRTNTSNIPTNSNPYYEVRLDNSAGFNTLKETSFVNINNARYLHMNQYESKFYNNLLDGDPKLDANWANYAQLGCSYYDWRGHQIINTNTGAVDNTLFSRELNDPINSSEFILDPFTPVANGERRLNSSPFFFHYDPTQKDTLYSDPQANDEQMRNENYSYGCFGRHSITGGVVIYPNKIINRGGFGVGLPPQFFTTDTGGVGTIETGRKLGYDRHWNAWGTATIGLTSGIPKYEYKQTYDGTKDFWDTETQNGVTPPLVSDPVIGNTVATIQGIYTQPGVNADDDFNNSVNGHLTNVYLGADSPAVAYDGAHFSFNNLHTPLNKGNLNTLTESDTSGDEAQIVYKINPQQAYNSWSPSMRPYEETIDFKLSAGGTAQSRRRVNRNLETFQVYDTTTGIFIEDFGYNQDVWDDSLWGRLGFTYNQLHNDNPPERQKRYTDFTDTSNILTTNADVKSRDIKSWQQNKFKESQYSNTLFHAFQFKAFSAGTSANQEVFLAFLPEIIAPTTSVSVVASDYPTQINNGFYNIRSDLALNVASVLGSGNNKYPIVGIADKTNSLKDFFISSPSSISHTITHPTTISSITTSITDPDGTPSRCSPNSVVIYRITRSVDTSFNILGDLEKKLQELELEKQKK